MELTKNINKNIFRGYDIRGVYPTDLNEDVAYTIGRSYGAYIKKWNQTKCIVGHDNRYSSDELTKALVTGIIDSGTDVVYLGLVTTPMFYYSQFKLEIPNGVMVTASHNPKDDNGFKYSINSYTNAKGQEIQDFYKYTIEQSYDEVVHMGTLSEYDIKDDYIKLFKDGLKFGNRKVKVVLDPGNGTTTAVVEDIFKALNLEYDIICGESNPTFPNHHPDPCVESNLTMLKDKVKELHADVGLAFDGDGDRIGIVDEKGNYIPADKYMIIIIRDIINKVSKKEFLYDVKCSKALSDEIEKLGAKGICYRTGNSYTKARIRDLDLPFGGELAGHVYFRDRWLGFDSGIYAGLRLVEILSNTDKSVSDLLEGINKYYSTEELKFSSTDEKKVEVVAKITEYAKTKSNDINTIDGVRVTFDDGWALIRYSNTGPNITARFEANTESRLEELVNEYSNLINEYNK